MFPNYLKIAVITAVDLFLVNRLENGTVEIIGGQEREFLDILSEKLSFSYSAFIPDDMEWGRQTENGSWTGMVGMVHRNEVDIAVGKTALIKQRTFYVDFSYPYLIEDLIFSTKIPGYLPRTTSFLYPFSWRVWMCIFSLLIVMPLTFCLILRKGYSIQKNVFVVFSHLINKPYPIKITSNTDKLLVCFWVLGAIVLSYCYTALLLSFLTIPLKEPSVETIEQLANALKGGSYKCFIIKGTSFVRSIQESKVESVMAIAEFIERNDWYIDNNKEVMMEYLSQSNTALISPESDFELLDRDKLFLSEDPFVPVMFSIILNKQFCCKKAVDAVLRRITEGGIYKKLEQDFYFRNLLSVRVSQKNYDSLNPQALELFEDLSGVFSLLLFGYVSSFTCFLTEVAHHKIKHYAK